MSEQLADFTRNYVQGDLDPGIYVAALMLSGLALVILVGIPRIPVTMLNPTLKVVFFGTLLILASEGDPTTAIATVSVAVAVAVAHATRNRQSFEDYTKYHRDHLATGTTPSPHRTIGY